VLQFPALKKVIRTHPAPALPSRKLISVSAQLISTRPELYPSSYR